VNDLLHYWEDDPATDTIALAVGSVGRVEKFLPLARRIAARKQVLALASDEPACDAALRAAGIALFETPSELLSSVKTR
jgi:acyl-CoA synthetase (NDP forming)